MCALDDGVSSRRDFNVERMLCTSYGLLPSTVYTDRAACVAGWQLAELESSRSRSSRSRKPGESQGAQDR